MKKHDMIKLRSVTKRWMNSRVRINKKIILQSVLSLFLLTAFTYNLKAQNQPPKFVREAVSSVEKMLDSQGTMC